MGKKIGCIIIVLMLLGLVLGAFGAYSWYTNAIKTPAGSSDNQIEVEITKGESPDQIATDLFTRGLVIDKNAFFIYMKLNPALVDKIQAGFFYLKPNMTIPEVAAALQKAANKDDIRVTVLEGLRIDEVADALAIGFTGKAPNFSKDEFLKLVKKPDDTAWTGVTGEFLQKVKPAGKTLEGFLFPDTYLFAPTSDAKAVIEKMVENLASKISADDFAKLKVRNYAFYDSLVIASLIERETFTKAEKPLISDVFYKRLEKGVNGVKLLQVDAALLYLAEDWKADAFRLKSQDTPYNTYMHSGLPPTPICSPGIDSIKAAIYPESNDYYFYIHDNNGVVHFARTLSEHQANIRQYL
jgi:UPF0755 protein